MFAFASYITCNLIKPIFVCFMLFSQKRKMSVFVLLCASFDITQNQVRTQVEFTLKFFNNLFCPWKIEHQRTTHIEQMTKFNLLENRQKYNERRRSHLAATGWKWQSKGDTVTKVPKPTTPLTARFQSEIFLLPCRISFSTTFTTAHRRKGKEQST